MFFSSSSSSTKMPDYRMTVADVGQPSLRWGELITFALFIADVFSSAVHLMGVFEGSTARDCCLNSCNFVNY